MVFEKTIGELVDENYVYARAMHFLGIDFLSLSNRKLKDVCLEKGIDKKLLVKSFYAFDSATRPAFKELEKYPVSLLLQYLKFAHHKFIKEQLPYIVQLVNRCEEHKSLQLLLPEFVEDFIKHIYEEEDHTFQYIEVLASIENGEVHAPYSKLARFGEKYSLEEEVASHSEEDELAAIRELIMSIAPSTLQQRVILAEMKAFDREMFYHAEIENELLFPKALDLEEKVQSKLKVLATLN